ncbi:MAG: hypothetical protein NC453_13305 [Muribaculum sp.]|nr:hypothetical protein [Muribaculum sp.]
MMNIKRHLFVMLLSLLTLSCWAEEMSYAAKTFRSNIQGFLREEGFAPSIDNDGSLCFKKEGTSYWIDVLGDKPFYVTFHREPIGTEDASSTNVLKAINDVNTNIRAIKCCYMNDHVSLAIESYCYVAEDFKYVFYQYLGILEASNELVKEAYAKYDNSSSSNKYSNNSSSNGGSSYRSSSSSTTTSSSRSGNKVFINGPIMESSHHKWWATGIELNTYNTVVSMVVVPKTTSTYVCSTKDEYIEDCDTGKKYYIQSSSIGIDPKSTSLYSKQSKSFTNTFPALPSSVKRINIWSRDGYYARNLQIR